MSNTNDNKILSKIQKLLALSDSPNQHEAEAAMAMAVKLSTQHNIDLSRVSVDQRQPDEFGKETIGGESSRLPVTMLYTVSIIQKFFSVRILTSGNRANGRGLTFIGKKSDIENAKFIYGFLNSTFLRLWHNFYKNNRHLDVKTARKSYFLGLFRGLSAKLEDAKKSVESTIDANDNRYQIMIVNNAKALDNAVIQFFPRSRTAPKNRTRYESNAAITAGERDGAKINIHAGLNGSKTEYLSA